MRRRFTALADDLSGAAEIAPLLAATSADGRFTGVGITLDASAAPHLHTERDLATVIDLDVRDRGHEEARDRVDAVLAALQRVSTPVDVVKIDSLLRGPIRAVVTGLQQHGARVVLAPALPQLGRTTVAGRLRIDGHPPERFTDLALDAVLADGDIAAALRPVTVEPVPLATVLAGAEALASALEAAHGRGAVPLVDAETREHLDVIAVAGRRIGATLVGSAGIAAAVGRHLATDADEPEPPALEPRSVLVVVGTSSAVARHQLDALRDAGLTRIDLSHDALLRSDGDLVAVRSALLDGDAVIAIDPAAERRPELAARLVARLGALAAELGHGSHLVLTGGATARGVLDASGIRHLRPVRMIEHGCVLSLTDDGRAVVTRPGSFGTAGTLVAAVQAIRALQASSVPPRKATIR